MYSETYGVICAARLSPIATPFPYNASPGAAILVLPARLQLHLIHAYPYYRGYTYNRLPIPLRPRRFWVARCSYKYFLTPFNRILRFLLDYFMQTRVMYHALHASGLHDTYIIQDVVILYMHATEFMTCLSTSFNQYPIWLWPLKQSGNHPSTTYTLKTNDATLEMMLNFSV